jgi:ankyrin repeat protein
MAKLELIEAVRATNLAAVKELIASGADVNQEDDNGWTPLCWGAGKGDAGIVQWLIERGADIRKTGHDQRTPSMIAIAAGHTEAARALLVEEAKRDIWPLPRAYCKAYHLRDLRQFSGWVEGAGAAPDSDAIVYVHQNYRVTRSIYADEDIVFESSTPAWRDFCRDVLRFKVPEDLDLVPTAVGAS